MEKEKKDFLLYQWLFFIPFSVLAMLGGLIVSLIALFLFICAAKYTVASFMLESDKIFLAVILTLSIYAVVAVLVFSVVMLIKKYIKAVDNFKEEKKAIFEKSGDSQSDN